MTEAQIRVVDASVKQMELGGVGLEGEVSIAVDAVIWLRRVYP